MFVLKSQVFIAWTYYLRRIGLGVGHCGSRTALSMRYERSNEYAPRTPLCSSCAQIMRLARMTSRFSGLPDLYTFECRACGVAHIEAATFAGCHVPAASVR